MQTLNEILDAALKAGGPEFYKSQVPAFIYTNLKEGYGQRPYQQEAFGRFVFYWSKYHSRPVCRQGRTKDVPAQLLYHMATGSGKTVIMAGLIIYLYERGYRNFLFFVNSTNIIDKTRDNFFNTASSKYLFSDTVSIGSNRIRITEAANFQAAHPDDLTIIFSTIQGLHSRLTTPTENSLTYDDFEDKKIVLISDEAHHINAETKKGNELGKEEKEELLTWEGTVNRILKTNRENLLLEFTATADLSVPEIQKKYSDKLIVDYPLKQFRLDGYSKEVKVLQADLSPFDRALQGILLSQYRRKIFEKYKKLIKPVILFKSKTIQESQSFFEAFTTGIKNLKASDLEKIKKSGTDEVIKKVFHYLDENNISFENLVAELKEDFSEEKLISINSKDESDQKQLAVNSLEDETNEYRAVFAVDKLNEGWDVLNLFDIVRLYDTQDTKDGKPGKTTLSEAQLIGRGARYCPFRIAKEQSPFTRKFDDDTSHELRICEELYYHSGYNPRYIQELNMALEEIGIKAARPIVRRVGTPNATAAQIIERPRESKNEFKETPFYKTELRLMNDQNGINLASILGDRLQKVTLKTGYTQSSMAFGNTQPATIERRQREYRLTDFGEHIIRKAINRLAFYQFSNLKRVLPDLQSISEFITSDAYLGKVKLDVSGSPEQLNNLSPREKLEASVKVLEDIAMVLASGKMS
jgi:type III restriction enzyme